MKNKLLVLIVAISLMVSACQVGYTSPQAPAGISPEQSQATANAAVLTAMANIATQTLAPTTDKNCSGPMSDFVSGFPGYYQVSNRTSQFYAYNGVTVMVTCVDGVASAITNTNTAMPPTSTSVPPTASAYNPPINQTGCLEGEVPGNYQNDLTRTPVGLGENVSLVEGSYRVATNAGYKDFARFNVLIQALSTQYQVFMLNMSTVHMNRYCGTIDQVRAYVGFPESGSGMPPHVRSMRQTAVDSKGNAPDPKSICVVEIDLVSGTLKVLWDCPLGPSLDEIMSHIEIVKVNN